ncbi:hypothetical protein DXV75_11435 [Alteromonas aestuariivivens]|uniref:Uncharacterized protein n=1 Tax=Alteromonas aestuariivivens TaxID=1938339 RepID=A0A3D8M7R8_9ALTE|nr:hypothetical protein DXV75_11435 [Alteromonas aestuariivivens]
MGVNAAIITKKQHGTYRLYKSVQDKFSALPGMTGITGLAPYYAAVLSGTPGTVANARAGYQKLRKPKPSNPIEKVEFTRQFS